MKIQFPEAHFGKVGKVAVDWRKAKQEADVDDEELAETPTDVLKMLGFDPLEIKKLKAKTKVKK